jgi:hypothetical protein
VLHEPVRHPGLNQALPRRLVGHVDELDGPVATESSSAISPYVIASRPVSSYVWPSSPLVASTTAAVAATSRGSIIGIPAPSAGANSLPVPDRLSGSDQVRHVETGPQDDGWHHRSLKVLFDPAVPVERRQKRPDFRSDRGELHDQRHPGCRRRVDCGVLMLDLLEAVGRREEDALHALQGAAQGLLQRTKDTRLVECIVGT